MTPPETTSSSRFWLPIVLVLAAAAAAINIAGAIQLGQIPDFGYTRVGDAVQWVVPGGPADRAGFRDGDRLLAIEGVSIDDAAGLARLPRAEVGDMRRYRLARSTSTADLAEIESTLIPGPLPIEQRLGARLNAAIGLAFLVVGLLAYLRRGGGLGVALVGLGISAAVVMGNPPFRLFDSAFAPTLMWLWSVLSLLAAACFLHFATCFPAPRPVARTRWLLPAVYGPVALWAVAAGMRVPVPVLYLQLPYILLGVALLIAAARTTAPSMARTQVVRFLCLTVAALIPFLAIGILSATNVVTNPFVNQLGSVALVLVPIALAWTVLGSRREDAVSMP